MPVLDYGVTVVTVGVAEPVTLDEAKRHLRGVDAIDDKDLTEFITRARILVEEDTRQCFLSHTFDIKYDRFPSERYIEIPRSPLSSLTTFTYTDTNGDSQVWSSANYEVDVARNVIWLAYNVDWPSIRDKQNAITLRVVCGYGATDKRQILAKQVILMLVGHWYANRETVIVGTISKQIELAYNALITKLSRWSYP